MERDTIIAAMRHALEPLPYVNAMWLGGSSAMGTEDELSDIDAVLDVADGRCEDAFAAAEAALDRLAPIASRLRVPEPTWHGHAQRLYRLAGSPEHLLVDLVIMERSSDAPRFNEREIHGEPVVIFDKLGVAVSVSLDRSAHRQSIARRLASLRDRLDLFGHFPAKELARANELDALWRYQRFVIEPLISILRARHAPRFHDFAPRYLKRDFPRPVYERLMKLSFVPDPEALPAKIEEALSWAKDELAAIDVNGLEI